MDFSEGRLLGAAIFVHPELALRVSHGFVGRPLDFSKRGRVESSRAICSHFDADGVCIVNQVHGDTIAPLPDVVTSEPYTDADGIIFPLHTPGKRLLVGVRTADCVPLLLLGRQWGVAVHAGWRGLAKGIVERGVELLKHKGETEYSALIGPAAGGDRYEVGAEVIEALQPIAVHRRLASGKSLLDPKLTASERLQRSGVADIVVSPICTISDQRFHSFRRDGDAMGNNFAFVLTHP